VISAWINLTVFKLIVSHVIGFIYVNFQMSSFLRNAVQDKKADDVLKNEQQYMI